THGLRKRIDHPKVAGVIEAHGMRILEHPFAPKPNELTLRSVDLHRRLAAIERPDVAVGPDRDAGHGSRPLAAGRFFQRPLGYDFVAGSVVDARIRRGVLGLRKGNSRQTRQTKNNSKQLRSDDPHKLLQFLKRRAGRPASGTPAPPAFLNWHR